MTGTSPRAITPGPSGEGIWQSLLPSFSRHPRIRRRCRSSARACPAETTPMRWMLLSLLIFFSVLASGAAAAPSEAATTAASVSADPNDWPMYNRDVIGSRHNPAEKAIGRDNAGQLVEKWRFPPAGSTEVIGVVHATVVVNGCVYFGTET